MIVVVVRELGPLVAALLVLARIGTANVVELGTARAMGEVDALESLVNIYTQQKNGDKALARVKQQVEAVPNNAAYHGLLGYLQAQKGDVVTAQQELRRAEEISHNNAQASALLAHLQLTSGAVNQATSTWQAWMRARSLRRDAIVTRISLPIQTAGTGPDGPDAGPTV